MRIYLALIFTLTLALVGCTNKKRELQRTVVVEVNDRQMTTKEFADRLGSRLKLFDALSVKDPITLTRVKEAIIRQFVVESLCMQWAEKNGVELSQTELDREVERIRGNYPDDLSFRRALASENLPMEEWERNLRISLLQRKVAKKLVDDISPPSEEELKKYYESNIKQFESVDRVRLTQVVVATENDAKRLDGEVRKDRGATLGALARKFSIAPEASQDGDTGWIEKGTLPIFDQAFSLPVGGLSNILKSPYGYHIYKVTGKQPGGRLNYSQARDIVLRHLTETREQSIFSSWIEGQIKLAKVRRNESIISAINVQTRGN